MLSEWKSDVCVDRPQEFLKCELPVDLKGNSTARDELGYGCVNVRRLRL